MYGSWQPLLAWRWRRLSSDRGSALRVVVGQAEDRGSAIRITQVRGMVAGPKAFVKIETNQDIVGWGEVTGLVPSVAVALLESFRELLVDENPTRVEHLWQKVYRSHRDMRGGPFMTHCLSAVDMALWDITGKKWGVPVYRLLGGPCRDRIRMYPSLVATKLGTGGPHPFSGNPDDINRLANMIKDRRQKEGPTYTIMFDAHCAIPPAMLIQFAAAVASLRYPLPRRARGPRQHRGLQTPEGANPHSLGYRRARPHHLGHDRVSSERLHRHPATRRRPDRRHQPDAQDRHPGQR